MLSYEEIMNYCSNYKIDNGIVIDKNTNQQVIDEEIVLRVKTSILVFKESKDAYQSDIQQFGKTNKSQEDYIKKTMEKFGVNNESNSYGINKLVNAILNSNGHYEEMMSGNDLKNSKFSILIAPKNEYGMAYLKLKFREKGLDIEDLRISQDLSELQHNGVSKVIINFKIKQCENAKQNVQNNISQSNIQHPRANELNELERQKQLARQNNDEVSYKYIQSSIEKIIRKNRMQISPEKWDSYTIEQKESYIQIKMKEAKILNDKDEFNYWLAILNDLKEKNIVNSTSKIDSDSEIAIKTTLKELKKRIGNTDGYTILVHGTHFTDEEVKNLIFKEGLRTTGKNEETSLNYTTQPLDINSYSVDELIEKFEKYDHNNRNMVIIRLPNEYFNIYDTTADRDCRKSRAFMKGKVQVDGGYKYVLNPKFIVGSYNTETMETMLNNSFEKELTPETIMTLKTNLANLYNELGIDIDYIDSINSEEIIETNQPLYNNSSTKNDYQEMTQEQGKKDYKYYYQELMKAVEKRNNLVNLTEAEKKQIVGEIFYNQGFLVENLNTQQEFNEVMNSLENDLNDIQLKKIILADMQERYNKLFKNNNDSLDNHQQVHTTLKEQTELTTFINQLREKMNKVKAEYKYMLLDGYIDDVELAVLISRTNELIDNANSLKTLANNQNEVILLNSIAEMLQNEQKKMITMQKGIEKIEETRRLL